MSTIPKATVTTALDYVTVEQLCFEQALSALGNRRDVAALKGYVEATLEANSGLAAHGAFLPRGTRVLLPEYTIQTDAAVVRLWS